MNAYILILFFIFGTVFGSFFCVVGYRRANKESIITPGSHCQNCKHPLGPFELIPVLSYLIQRGKCKHCKAHISIFYPIVELFTGILFMISYYSFGFSYDLVIALLLSSYFSIVVITDLNYYMIPDEITIFFGICIAITTILKYGLNSWEYLLNGLIMFIFMYLIMKIGNFIFKQESLGGGDIKLLFVLGMTMPFILSLLGISLACALALPVACYLYFKKNDKAVPFGPFLIGAFLILFLLKIDPQVIFNYLFLQ